MQTHFSPARPNTAEPRVSGSGLAGNPVVAARGNGPHGGPVAWHTARPVKGHEISPPGGEFPVAKDTPRAYFCFMSVDGPGLFESDGSHDARARYLELFAAGVSASEGTATLIEEWNGLLDDPWEGPDFWIALAATQLEVGRLEARVRDQALSLIDSGVELARWEYSLEFLAVRRPLIEDLRNKLADAPSV